MHSLIHSLARSLTRTFIIHQLDAINVHPFEFVVGEYLHLLTIYLVPCHVCTAVFFVLAGGVFASLNHTRFDIDLPGGIYSVKNHDVHHRDVQKNFGQYIMLWDHALGSYLSYDAKPHRQEVVAPVKGMTTAELLAKTKAKTHKAQ
jgi:sterol desaturase/sphingolipid hydroxylase (fatty acid hydroxylase superfamily)